MTSLKRTALYDEHIAAGARLVPFAGWEMPVQYSGVINEVRAVREGCGVFDVSHMGQLLVDGSDTTNALNHAVSSEVDDAHLKAHLPELMIKPARTSSAMLAIQGPRAESVLKSLIEDVYLSQVKWRDCVAATINEAHGVLARGGYTGSDGFEFMFHGDDAPRVWRALLEAGATPCGLGARDVLRLEAGLPLYGHELREEWTPFESSCGWAVKLNKDDFIGRAALLDQQQPEYCIRALKMQDKAIPREGYVVAKDGQKIGEVTSGTLSPTLGIGIALSMLPTSLAVGETVEVLVRATVHPAVVVERPFVPHARR
jgi:aminomethyltransferase